MNWTALAAAGELIGALAVVLSLVYLSRQVQQNTRAVRTANAATVQGNLQALGRSVITDRGTGAVLLRALRGDPTLSPPEQLSAYAWFFDTLKGGELAYHQYLNGQLDQELWEAALAFYMTYWTTPGVRAYWERRRGAYTPQFQTALDNWLSAPGIAATSFDRLYGEGATGSAEGAS